MKFKITDKNEATSPPPQPFFVALIRVGMEKLVPYAKNWDFIMVALGFSVYFLIFFARYRSIFDIMEKLFIF